MTGASFTDITIISISSVAMALPWESSTVNVTVSVPYQFNSELNVTIYPSMDIWTWSFPDAVNIKPSSSISSMYSPKSSVILSSSLNTTLSGKSITGLSFTGRTVNVNTVLSVYSPSDTDTLISTEPLKSSAGLNVNSDPDTHTLTSEGEPLNALNVNASPSTSSADKVKVISVSSFNCWSTISTRTGASFTAVTIISISSVAMALPCESSTMNVTVSVPYQFNIELNVTTYPSMNIWTFSCPVALKLKPSSSISSMNSVKSSTLLPSSENVTLKGKSIVGASFTGNTIKVNISLSVYSPSVTDTLICTSP